MSEPDYRPFLRDGDLVTAEDVLKWLRSPVGARVGAHRAWLLKNDAREWAYLDHYEDETMLAARLDRERRRACRRAAREHFHTFATSARLFEHGSKACHDALCQALLGTRRHDGSLDSEPFGVWRTFAEPLANALAFRAAARAK